MKEMRVEKGRMPESKITNLLYQDKWKCKGWVIYVGQCRCYKHCLICGDVGDDNVVSEW